MFDHLRSAEIADPRAVEAMTPEQRTVFGLLGPGWVALVHVACATMGAPYPADVDERERVLDRLELADPELRVHQELDARLNTLEVDEPADERIDAYIAARPAAFFW